MSTIKQILTENRDSVISSIKFSFKVYNQEQVKEKMIEFLEFMEAKANVSELENSTKIKSYLKIWVGRMKQEQKKENNIQMYGTTNPSLAEICSTNAFNRGEEWDSKKGIYVKY